MSFEMHLPGAFGQTLQIAPLIGRANVITVAIDSLRRRSGTKPSRLSLAPSLTGFPTCSWKPRRRWSRLAKSRKRRGFFYRHAAMASLRAPGVPVAGSDTHKGEGEDGRCVTGLAGGFRGYTCWGRPY